MNAGRQPVAVTGNQDGPIGENTMVRSLTQEEQKDWEAQERIIREGLKSYVEVGEALKQIHAKDYFKPLSWKEYLKLKFSLSPGRAQRLMNAASIHELLTKHQKDHLPSNEHVAATLHDKWGGEKPEVILDVWDACCEMRGNRPVTSGIISKVTRERNGYESPAEKRDRAVLKLESLRSVLADLQRRPIEELPPDIVELLNSIKKQVTQVWKNVKMAKESSARAA